MSGSIHGIGDDSIGVSVDRPSFGISVMRMKISENV